jgi:UDP-N-acetylmuramyl-tripeptide synthetase
VAGTDLRIATPSGELRIESRLVGRTNAYNVAAAVAAALALGIGREAIPAGIESLEGVPGRTELIDCGQRFAVVVDYAHTPDALEKILEMLAELPHRSIITVFGCGGDRDRTKRPIMGRIAAERSDRVVATSDNPRSEKPEAILAEIEVGLRQGKAAWSVEVDRRAAIEAAITAAGPGDIVLIAGKGHEGTQVIGNRKLPFDDRKVAREVLTQLGAVPGGRGARRE